MSWSHPRQQQVAWYPSQYCPNLKTGCSQIILCSIHFQVLFHAGYIGVRQVGLVEPFCEIGKASKGENKEVNFEEQFLLRCFGAFWIPEEKGRGFGPVRRGEDGFENAHFEVLPANARGITNPSPKTSTTLIMARRPYGQIS